MQPTYIIMLGLMFFSSMKCNMQNIIVSSNLKYISWTVMRPMSPHPQNPLNHLSIGKINMFSSRMYTWNTDQLTLSNNNFFISLLTVLNFTQSVCIHLKVWYETIKLHTYVYTRNPIVFWLPAWWISQVCYYTYQRHYKLIDRLYRID
jgi:hypothetical protein